MTALTPRQQGMLQLLVVGEMVPAMKPWIARLRQRAEANERLLLQPRPCRPARVRRSKAWVPPLTPPDYQALFVAQGGRCAICKRKPEEWRRLAVDHDHETNEIRGLLCSRCNTALGLLGDTAALLRAAADYLDGFRDLF